MVYFIVINDLINEESSSDSLLKIAQSLYLMKLIFFSLQVDFLTPKVFCASAARKLAPIFIGAQTSSPSKCLLRIWIPSPQKLLWLKSTLRSKIISFILLD